MIDPGFVTVRISATRTGGPRFMGIVPNLSEKQATRLLIASECKKRLLTIVWVWVTAPQRHTREGACHVRVSFEYFVGAQARALWFEVVACNMVCRCTHISVYPCSSPTILLASRCEVLTYNLNGSPCQARLLH